MKSKTSTKTTAKSKPATKEKAKTKAPVKKVAKAVKKVLPVRTTEKPQVKEVDKSLEPVATQVLNVMPLQPSCPKIVCTCGTMYMKLVKDGPHRTWRCQKCGTEYTELNKEDNHVE